MSRVFVTEQDIEALEASILAEGPSLGEGDASPHPAQKPAWGLTGDLVRAPAEVKGAWRAGGPRGSGRGLGRAV